MNLRHPLAILPAHLARLLSVAPMALMALGVACGAVSAAQAQGWAPKGCGEEPDAPAMHTGTVEQYNASVDKFNAYAKSARNYNDCMVKEAAAAQAANNAEATSRNQAISGTARQIQARIGANFSKDSAELKTAGARLKQ